MSKLDVINEALGEFPQQYALAKEIAKKVINMVKTHDISLEFEPSVDNKFKMVQIELEYSEDDESFKSLIDIRPTSGSFNGVNDNIIAIKFFIARNDVLKQSYDKLEQTIYHIAAHELNHGYVILAQSKYNEKGGKDLITPLPEWYNSCIVFLENYKRNDTVYQFVQGLYACYEKEVKAIISETTPQIEIYLEKIGRNDRDSFIAALENSESFQRYYIFLHEVLPNVEKNKEKVIKCLDFWGFDVNDKTFNDLLRFVRQRASVALHYIQKNAMLYYHRFIKHEKTDWFETHPLK